MTPSVKSIISHRGQWAARQQIGYLMQQGVDYPDCLSLAAGLVDYQTLPTELVAEVTAQILHSSRGQAALQYGTTPGSVSLRKKLIEHTADLDHITKTEYRTSVEQCLLTTGSQQFLDFVTQAVCNPGDICLVTAPTYFVYLSTLEAAGVEAIPVACDEQGILPCALEEKLRELASQNQLSRVKLLYLVTYYDNPRGTTLPESRRLEVLAILRKWAPQQWIYLLEDAAYRELWFDEPPPPSCYALDETREMVIYTQTFSKSLSPGLRVAWGFLPQPLVKPVVDLKSVHDFGSPHLAQFVVEDLLQSGRYFDHVATLRANYKHKAEVLWRAIETELLPIPGTMAIPTAGGLYIWLTLPPAQFSTRFAEEFFSRCASQHQVMFVPGELFFSERSDAVAASSMRLSFGVQPTDKLAEGIHRLAAACQSALAESSSS